MITPEEQESLETYDATAAIFAVQKYTPDFWQKEFEQFQRLLPKGKILDIGCGWGRDSLFFDSEHYEYVGVDLSKNMVAEASKLHPDKAFQVMDLYNLDFPEAFFDGIWSAVSLLHVPRKNITKALEQVKKVVKKDGLVFLSCKRGTGEGYEILKDSGLRRYFAYYTSSELTILLEQNGFKVLSIYDKDSPVEAEKKYVCAFCTLDLQVGV